MATTAWSLASIFLLLLVTADGSLLTIDVSRAEIHANLTPSLTLTCGVNGSMTSPVSGVIVGRDLSHQVKADLEFVTSLMVMRNGAAVASMTEHTPAHGVIDLDNLEVMGVMSGRSGHLQLTWQFPGASQAGEYSCEANGISMEGHNVMLTESAEVNLVQPQLQDLVQYMHDQQLQIMNQQGQIQGLNNSVQQSKNVQTGMIECGKSSDWKGTVKNRYGYTDIYTTITHQFQQAYASPPVVFLSLEHIYQAVGNAGYFFLQLESVNSTSFTMRCRTHSASTYAVEYMEASWISVPH